jgi:spore germination protein KB
VRRGRLTARQLFWIALIGVLPTVFLEVPGEIVRLAGRYAWQTPLIAAPPAAAFAWWVGRRGGGRGDLVQAASAVRPPWLGRVLLAGVWAAVGVLAVVALRETAEGAAATFIKGNVPLSALTLMILAVGGLLAWLGPVVIGRTSAVLAPTLSVTYLGGLMLVLPLLQLVRVLPLLPPAFPAGSWAPIRLEWLWLVQPALVGALLVGRLEGQHRRRAGAVLALATAVAAALLSAGLWVVVADFGPQRAAELALPFLNVSKELPYSAYLEHLDSLVMPIEMVSAMEKVGIVFWMWHRLACALVPVPAAGLMSIAAVTLVSGVLSMALFPNLLAVDRALYPVSSVCVPAFAVALAALYGLAPSRRRGGARAGGAA